MRTGKISSFHSQRKMAFIAACSIRKSPSVDNILDLNPELLLKIFTYLKFKDVCRVAKGAWQRMRDKVVVSLVSKGVRHLSVQVTVPNELIRILLAFPGLHGLRLDMATVVNRMDVVRVLRIVDLSSLKRLVLTPGYWQLYGADTVEGLVTLTPNLESLEFFADDEDVWTNSGAAIFTTKELKIILDRLKKLKKLVLMGPRFVSFRPVADFGACGSATLEHLNVWNGHFDGATLEVIGRVYPKLRHLEFHMGKYMGKDRAGDCRKYLKHVPVQVFHWCFNVSEENVAFIERQ